MTRWVTHQFIVRDWIGVGILTLTLSLTGCLDKEEIPPAPFRIEGAVGLKASYYTYTGVGMVEAFGRNSRVVLTRVDPQINFSMRQNGQAPAPGLGPNRFSVRWTGYLAASESADYMLCTCTDDGVRLQLDGVNVLSNNAYMNQNPRFWGTGKIRLEAGQRKTLRIDYYQETNSAQAQLFWVKNPSDSNWERVCWGERPDANQPSGILRNFECGSNVTLSPEVSLVPQGNLIPAGNEVEAELADCSKEPALLNETQLGNLSDPHLGRALRLFERLAGRQVSIFDERVKRVADLLRAGQDKQAARIVSEDNGFLDRTVRPFAARISTQAQVINVPLNDMIATIAGVTRDRIDARQLLVGNFLYRGKEVLFWYDKSLFGRPKLLSSNQHYEEIEASATPLKCALPKMDRFDLGNLPKGFEQMAAVPEPSTNNEANASLMRVLPEPAGILTSRAFAQAHMIAGTNRRPVEKAFEYFLCAPIESLRTVEAPDTYVGRDVERFPNGPNSNADYQTNCKTCHNTLDSNRPAFSRFHFENGLLKYVPFFLDRPENIANNMEAISRVKLTPANQETPGVNTPGNHPVVWKINHNVNYPEGYFVKDSRWENLLASTVVGQRLGFTVSKGEGLREFGRMIATSTAFPRCMAKRVFQDVCKADPFERGFSYDLTQWIERVGDQFAQGGFDLRDLFETVALGCSH
jgi:hypothetical protein